MAKQLVLLGAGRAHVHLLHRLAKQPLADTQVTLVAPDPRQLSLHRVARFVAGHATQDECSIALAPLVQKSGVRWLQRPVVALDATAHSVQLDDASALAFDWLSINSEGVQNRSTLEVAMPGVGEHGLFVRPIETFVALWPRVAALGASRALRIAVVGAGTAGIELALAVRHAQPQSAITLITGGAAVASAYAPAVQTQVLAALKKRAITVLVDTATALTGKDVRLGCGARLACDVSLITTGEQAPAWLQRSGLALDAQGFVAVDACQRASSHPQVFVAGDDGVALAVNLAAIMSGTPLKIHRPLLPSLHFISCGDQHAIASWGHYTAQGRWVGWFKEMLDRRWMGCYRVQV